MNLGPKCNARLDESRKSRLLRYKVDVARMG